MNIDLIPALQDNYVYVVSEPGNPEVAIVDPSEFMPVYEYLQAKHQVIDTIFLTHHHPDHVGGVERLKDKYDCRVVAAKKDRHRIEHVDEWVEHKDEVSFMQNMATVYEIPGHTLGHIAYHFKASNHLFLGDTMFAVGCGRLFEGTPKMMMETLNDLAKLPPETIICCAHEYTLKNIEFARTIEPDNQALQQREWDEIQKRKQGLPTVPTRLDIELATNPFLRVHKASVKEGVRLPDGDLVDVFTKLRHMKDNF